MSVIIKLFFLKLHIIDFLSDPYNILFYTRSLHMWEILKSQPPLAVLVAFNSVIG